MSLVARQNGSWVHTFIAQNAFKFLKQSVYTTLRPPNQPASNQMLSSDDGHMKSEGTFGNIARASLPRSG